MSRQSTILTLFVILTILTASSLMIAFSYQQSSITAKASESHALLCINQPPIFGSSCQSSLNQSTLLVDNRIDCDLNISNELGEEYVLSIDSIPSGINATFNDDHLLMNSTQEGVGLQSFIISARDSSDCENQISYYEYIFTVLDINDPPQYRPTIPDTEFAVERTSSPYSLTDYFIDPDNDALNFSVIGNILVNFDINQITGDVRLSADDCGTEYVLYQATDPGNLSDESDPVEIKVLCEDENLGDGGSGGGAGAPPEPPCYSKWKCDDWSECYINGTRTKRCIDLNGCRANDYIRHFVDECEYNPTCFDGIQNGEETGVDCGGACRPCGTCFDGIQNQDEEGIDCGGTYCEACHNCFDGIQNWDEQGIDCGGAFCEACPSCFDGIQNQNETGIDCGGPCQACLGVETPAAFEEESGPLTVLAILIAVLAISLLILFKLYRKQIYAWFASLAWYFTRYHRKQIFLSDEEKVELLKDLLHLDKILKTNPPDTMPLLDHASDLGRRFFSYLFDIQFAFIPEEIASAINTKVNHGALQKVLQSLFVKQQIFETQGPHLTARELRVFVEELRQMVIQTSKVENADLSHDASEIDIRGTPYQRSLAHLYNASLALQFEEVNAAKKHYMGLIEIYDKLTPKQKEIVFPDTNRLFHEIRYLLSWIQR